VENIDETNPPHPFVKPFGLISGAPRERYSGPNLGEKGCQLFQLFIDNKNKKTATTPSLVISIIYYSNRNYIWDGRNIQPAVFKFHLFFSLDIILLCSVTWRWHVTVYHFLNYWTFHCEKELSVLTTENTLCRIESLIKPFGKSNVINDEQQQLHDPLQISSR